MSNSICNTSVGIGQVRIMLIIIFLVDHGISMILNGDNSKKFLTNIGYAKTGKKAKSLKQIGNLLHIFKKKE